MGSHNVGDGIYKSFEGWLGLLCSIRLSSLHHTLGVVLGSVLPLDLAQGQGTSMYPHGGKESHPTFTLSAWGETWLRHTLAYSSSECTEKIGDTISFGHFDKKRDRLCYVLGFSLRSHPRIFFLVNLAKMNIKDSLKGQPVGCLQKWSGILVVDL